MSVDVLTTSKDKKLKGSPPLFTSKCAEAQRSFGLFCFDPRIVTCSGCFEPEARLNGDEARARRE